MIWIKNSTYNKLNIYKCFIVMVNSVCYVTKAISLHTLSNSVFPFHTRKHIKPVIWNVCSLVFFFSFFLFLLVVHLVMLLLLFFLNLFESSKYVILMLLLLLFLVLGSSIKEKFLYTLKKKTNKLNLLNPLKIRNRRKKETKGEEIKTSTKANFSRSCSVVKEEKQLDNKIYICDIYTHVGYIVSFLCVFNHSFFFIGKCSNKNNAK